MEDRSLSARTVRGLHATLRTALDQAVKERLIPFNPAIGCRLSYFSTLPLFLVLLYNFLRSSVVCFSSLILPMLGAM